jgi:predicted Fe-Mo cluster-binding NifX family protein
MKVCIPIEQDLGMESPVCAHFGAAPAFLIVDTETQASRCIGNGQHEDHGQCAPVGLLLAERVDALAVVGIGRGAIQKLGAAGISVVRTQSPTAGETVRELLAGTLPTMTMDGACTQHGHGHDHA